jgi:hypothetical protein
VDDAFENVMFTQQLNHLVNAIESSGLDAGDQSWLFQQQRTNIQLLERRIGEFPPVPRRHLEWHLCRYRNAMLQVRFLQPETNMVWPTHLFLERHPKMKLTDIITTNQNLGVDLTEELRVVLDTVEELISQLGFDGASEQLTSDDFESLPTRRGDRQPINVIPSEGRTSCASTVLALFNVAGTRKPATGFRTIMSELRTHLVDCHPITRNAILITDWWNAEIFAEEHFNELAAWKRKGVQVLILLVSQPGSTLTPLRVWS